MGQFWPIVLPTERISGSPLGPRAQRRPRHRPRSCSSAHKLGQHRRSPAARMRRSAPSVRSLSASASSSAAKTMSFAPRYRGGGRRPLQRSFSDQRDNAGRGQYMASGSQSWSVQDASLMSLEGEGGDSPIKTGSQLPSCNGRQPYNRSFHLSSQLNHDRQYPPTESRPPFSRGRPYNHNQSFRFRPPSPPYYNHNQQFAPPEQYDQNPRLYRPPPNSKNLQFPQQPLPHPSRPSYQSSPYYQNQRVGGRTEHSPPRPPPALNFRKWEFAGSQPSPNCKRFVVLSYNILADYLALNHRSKLYYHIPRYMLEWDWRKRNIIFELGLWSADIMCFQEVDRFQDLMEELKLRGYSGIWKMRTGDPVDGCAIFWHTSRFKLLHEESIEFNKLGLRDNVAQICVLEFVSEDSSDNAGTPPLSSAGSNRIVVCNIHVLYNPRRGEIKLGQIRVLLESAHVISKSWDNAPIVLCGDFNCTPKSPMYNFISEQQLNLSEVDRDKVSGQASAEIHGTRPYFHNNQELPADKSIKDLPKVENASEHKEPHLEGTKSGPETALDITSGDAHSSSHASCIKIGESSSSQEGGGFPEDLRIADNVEQKFSDGCCDLSKERTHFRSTANEPDDMNISSSVTAVDQSSHPITNNEDSAAVLVDEKLKALSLNELDEPIVEEGQSSFEDDTEFLEALHDGDDSLPPESLLGIELEPVEEGKTVYDPSVWTAADIATATGSEDCLVLEHKLKLKSTYTEVEDFSRTRDPNGEPLVTSYNSRFMGTVDYIWRSEGLQTVRVLAPIPKQAMQLWTQGFPTKKWGSDHIALVSELAITSDVVSDHDAQVLFGDSPQPLPLADRDGQR